MRLIVGVQLDFDDIARLTHLRNYLKSRNRKLYLLVRQIMGEHFKAKHNGVNGWHFVCWFSIPPIWFTWEMFRFDRWIAGLVYRIQYRLGYRWCMECSDMTKSWRNTDTSGCSCWPICYPCWHSINEQYLQDEIEYLEDPRDGQPISLENL